MYHIYKLPEKTGREAGWLKRDDTQMQTHTRTPIQTQKKAQPLAKPKALSIPKPRP